MRPPPSLVPAALALSLLGAAACPPSSPPLPPPPGSSGAGGVAVSGAGGAPSSAGAGGGTLPTSAGAGGYAPAGAGGMGGTSSAPEPLCHLPAAPWPGPDAQLTALRASLVSALAEAGPEYPPTLPAWLAYREPVFGAPGPSPVPGTTLALVGPAGLRVDQIELVRFHLHAASGTPLGGHVEAPRADCATCGLRNPCGDSPPRVLGIALDVPALPLAARRAPARAR